MTENWSYSSANKIKIEGDVSSKYYAGFIIYIQQNSTDKYFLVTSVSVISENTYLDLQPSETYTLTSDPITLHRYNSQGTAPGLPPLFRTKMEALGTENKALPADNDLLLVLDSEDNSDIKNLKVSDLQSKFEFSTLAHTHTLFSGYDIIIYQSSGNTIAENGWTHAVIDSGTTGPTVNTRVMNAAITACPTNGSIYIASGTYYLNASNSCTAGPEGYLTYNVALPVTRNMHISGAGMGATILMLAASQHYTDHPALLMYVYHPYSDGGFGTAYTAFSLKNMTFDGNASGQTIWHYDGAGLFLNGSMRYNGVYSNLEFRNSADSGFYSGYNGAGWEVNGIFENIYSHDNAEFDQFDNPEQCVLNGFISENNGHEYNHIGLIIDTMDTGERSLTASDITMRDGMLFIFGPAGHDPNPDTAIQISNLNIDNSDIDCNGIYIEDFGNVNINGGRIRVNTASNYAIYLQHASDVVISNIVMSGLRGIVSASGTKNSIDVHNCQITTASHVMIMQTGDIYNFYGCKLTTEDNAAYIVAAAVSRTIGLFNCVSGNGYGIIASTGTINHVGTFNMGLEASGSASVADGGTITHGLKVTPRYVTIQPSVEGTIATPSSIGATTFAVNFSGVTDTQTVYWHAKY